jgi:hypothetical protein
MQRLVAMIKQWPLRLPIPAATVTGAQPGPLKAEARRVWLRAWLIVHSQALRPKQGFALF